jgi:hypothetical protein
VRINTIQQQRIEDKQKRDRNSLQSAGIYLVEIEKEEEKKFTWTSPAGEACRARWILLRQRAGIRISGWPCVKAGW